MQFTQVRDANFEIVSYINQQKKNASTVHNCIIINLEIKLSILGVRTLKLKQQNIGSQLTNIVLLEGV